jgi:hypothetical protein
MDADQMRNVLIHPKHGELYVLVYSDGEEQEAFQAILPWVHDLTLSFTMWDAAWFSEAITSRVYTAQRLRDQDAPFCGKGDPEPKRGFWEWLLGW